MHSRILQILGNPNGVDVCIAVGYSRGRETTSISIVFLRSQSWECGVECGVGTKGYASLRDMMKEVKLRWDLQDMIKTGV